MSNKINRKILSPLHKKEFDRKK